MNVRVKGILNHSALKTVDETHVLTEAMMRKVALRCASRPVVVVPPRRTGRLR